MKTKEKIMLLPNKWRMLYLAAITASSIQAQITADIDINNIKARLNPAGDLFWDFTQSKFEVPKGSGNGTVFNANLWIGGMDVSTLKMAAQTYRTGGSTDFWPGPLDTTTVSIDAATSNTYNKVWKINRSTIDSFIQGKLSTPPPSITGWPGNGNTANRESKYLAPFYDKDKNGIYNPASGDYPLIRGDQAVFFIYNDKLGLHSESTSNPIGIEIHGMAYAFSCSSDSALRNTLFIHYDIINRSSSTLDKTYLGLWADLDIGDALNDFIGSDVMRNCFYGYDGSTGDSKYGTKPAAQAVVFLKGPKVSTPSDGLDSYGTSFIDSNGNIQLSRFVTYNNNLSNQGNPTKDTDYYNYLSGSWIDGSPLTYGGGGSGGSVTSNFMYPGNSDPLGKGTGGVSQSLWDEASASNLPGDRRGLGSCGPFTMLPGSTNNLDIAFVFGQDVTGSSSPATAVAVMKERVDSIRSYYSKNITPCGNIIVYESDLVWPGDANRDLVADNKDILAVGVGYDSIGPIRPNATINWIGQPASDWGTTLSNGKNYKNVDCNGDGLIDKNDTSAIIQNYGLTHALKLAQAQYIAGLPDLTFAIPTDTTLSGTTINVPIMLGTSTNQATGLYGLAFSINYDPKIVDTTKLSLSLNSSWLGTNGTDLIFITKNFRTMGRLDVGITRIDHKNVSGFGKIGDLSITMRDDMQMKAASTIYKTLTLDAVQVKAISNDETIVLLNAVSNSIVVKQEVTTGVIKYNLSTGFQAYPNPVSDLINIELKTSDVKEVKLLNIIGENVWQQTNNIGSRITIDTQALPAGTYYLSVTTSQDRIVKQVNIIR